MRAAARLPRPADVRQDAREAKVAPSARKTYGKEAAVRPCRPAFEESPDVL